MLCYGNGSTGELFDNCICHFHFNWSADYRVCHFHGWSWFKFTTAFAIFTLIGLVLITLSVTFMAGVVGLSLRSDLQLAVA